jgi:aspartyl-tRNA(Asn)/glutamyl-tRNA(Gln) amidotransferase subunit A
LNGGATLELTDLTIMEAAKKLREKEISVPELASAYLQRIQDMDNSVGAYITVCDDTALKQAEKIQQRFDRGDDLPLLAGIPVGLMDNIATRGVITSCGSKMLSNYIPPYDATVVTRLYNNHAILLGKLNMDEFAMGSSNENSWYGEVKNPLDHKRVTGGSAGGAAAAVASGMACFALGSDADGSVRQPASFCGVIGLKPTYGAVSRYGLVASASSMEQIGPITKDVTDCAAVMNAITGHDPMDSTSVNFDHPDYTSFLNKDIDGLKIGIPQQYMQNGLSADVKHRIVEAAKVLESSGAIVTEVSLPLTEYAIPAYYLISSAEASSNLARYDGIKYGFRASAYSDLLDLYCRTRSEGFGSEVKRRIMLGTYTLSSGRFDAFYRKSLKVRRLIYEDFQKVFKEVDLVMGPTSPTTAFKIGEKTDNPLEMYSADIYTVSVNMAGLCALSIPCGFDSNGLPVGMQLIGRPFDEGTLLKVGYSFERRRKDFK